MSVPDDARLQHDSPDMTVLTGKRRYAGTALSSAAAARTCLPPSIQH